MPTVLETYFPILVFGLIVAGIAFVTLNIGRLLGRPHRPDRFKQSTYECGEEPVGDSRMGGVDVQYYMYVLIFLVLDVEVLFLIPWALQFAKLGIAGVIEIFIFAGLLLVGWLYAWKKGALKWAE
ncbi:MAG: NADH-quinone oxidoreductase subunit A [Euryarchaeota archaeon]|nr:NADH-quinone oxidoreductase subunit A [Euryarchaeota archaeon]